MDILSLRKNVLSKDELKRCWDEVHKAELPTGAVQIRKVAVQLQEYHVHQGIVE
jgi:hypothetical protein